MSEPPPGSGFTYRAFISYSHRDKTWGDWLHRSLETYRVPSRLVGKQTEAGTIPRRLHPVFRDREELSSSPELGSKINAALAKSENLIVLCSPAAATSRWVNEEVLAYKRMGRGERIFCLIVGGEPNATDLPGREAEECFCPALRYQVDANGQPIHERTEPIAADAREGKDGKTNAKLKLIAGMLGVGFDALKQRDLQRRTRRMTAIAALALVVMAITSVLAVYALISRNQAVVAQHKAVIAQQAAQRRQKQAEDLVDFMLGDLNQKLQQVGRLDIMQSVNAKAMAYFKSLPPNEINTTAIAQHAMALQRIGEVRMDQNHLSDAMDAFREALLLNQRLVTQMPGDAVRQDAYAENLLWVGFADWKAGKLGHAQSAFQRSAAALERASALAPSNKEVQHNLDNIYDDLGHVAQARGELDATFRVYTKDLDLCKHMVVAHPHDVIWKNALGDAYDNLSTLALMRGHIDQAVAGYLKEQQILDDVVARQPRNQQMLQQLLYSDAILGRTLMLAGQTQAAKHYLDAALAIGKAQTTFDPSQKGWQEIYAVSQLLAGRLAAELGNHTKARSLVDASVASLRILTQAGSGESDWRRDLANAELEDARLAMADHQTDAAASLAGEAEADLQKLLAGDAPKAKLIRLAANAELLSGRLAAERGDAAGSGKDRRRALTRMQAVAAHSSDPRDMAILIEALLASGKLDKAQTTIKQLQATGYRDAGFVSRLHADGIDYVPDPAIMQRIVKALEPASTDPKVANAANR